MIGQKLKWSSNVFQLAVCRYMIQEIIVPENHLTSMPLQVQDKKASNISSGPRTCQEQNLVPSLCVERARG
jgi:hypothetical protein